MHRSAIADLRRIAASQHGLFTTVQAYCCGVTLAALREAVARGWLRSVRRGVYAFTGRPPSRWEPILAACLACGPAAIISHWSAAAIHGFWGLADASQELVFPGSGGRRMTGVRIHHTVDMRPDDVVHRSGVRVTSPVRTLIDVAPLTNDYRLPRMIDEGTIARLWTAEAIDARLGDLLGGRRGTRRLRRLLDERLEEAWPDNALEQRVIRVMKRWLPAFQVHHRIELGGRIIELDVAWPEHRLAAEIDGRQVRIASRTKFDADRLRSNLLETSGWRVVHLTSTMDDLTILAQVIPFFAPEIIDWRIRAEVSRRALEASRG